MSGPVIFDEEDSSGQFAASRRSSSSHKRLVALGLAGSFKHAAVIAAIACVVMFSISIYFLASSVQPAPVLGDDVLRPGESVPPYVR